tara:strand:- start:2333 stop:2683 length:351 start_codon:yes stop_codon:yes gene_type:complete
MNETENQTEAPVEATNQTEAASVDSTKQEVPTNVLLGSVSYQNLDDYNKFLDNLDVNQALFVLVSGCTFAQTKGAYSLDEAELVIKAIKTIKNQSKPPEETTSENEVVTDEAVTPA